jgi:hypothetical protein
VQTALLAIVGLAVGCGAGKVRVLDATVTNGSAGYYNAATLSPEAGRGAMIVAAMPWLGGASAAPGAPAQVDFVHFEALQDSRAASGAAAALPEASGSGASASGSSAGCVEAPALSITKQVEYEGKIADHLEIDTTDLEATSVELAWHLVIKNASRCSKLHRLRVLDNLPQGFVVSEVEARDDGPSGSAVFFGLVPFVVPVLFVLAGNDYGFHSFDESGWNVVLARGISTFIFEARMDDSPFAPGRHIHLVVRGRQAVPPRKGIRK